MEITRRNHLVMLNLKECQLSCNLIKLHRSSLSKTNRRKCKHQLTFKTLTPSGTHLNSKHSNLKGHKPTTTIIVLSKVDKMSTLRTLTVKLTNNMIRLLKVHSSLKMEVITTKQFKVLITSNKSNDISSNNRKER